MKLVGEPSFEANCEDGSYGFRPRREAHQAVGASREALNRGLAQACEPLCNKALTRVRRTSC